MTNVNEQVSASMTIKLSDRLPELQDFEKGIRRAPKRELTLNEREIKLALKMPYDISQRHFTSSWLQSF